VLRIERDDLARLIEEIPALRETMDATVARHVSADVPAKSKAQRRKVNASIPADLADRFEDAAAASGAGVASALEDALTQWIERNDTAKR
jgi:hypothetical protein